MVAKYTIGVDDVDVDAATEYPGVLRARGVPESNWGGVADGTITGGETTTLGFDAGFPFSCTLIESLLACLSPVRFGSRRRVR